MDKSTSDALAVEHEIQRLMLERLGIEWTPGEPFYSLVEAEIERLRVQVTARENYTVTQEQRAMRAETEIERLQATINDLVALIKYVDADANNIQLDIAKVFRKHRLDA